MLQFNTISSTNSNSMSYTNNRRARIFCGLSFSVHRLVKHTRFFQQGTFYVW